MAQASQPPPIPSNRPKTQYVPPPIPTNRPKSSYVPPLLSGSASSIKKVPSYLSGPARPAPKPSPRISVSDSSPGQQYNHQGHSVTQQHSYHNSKPAVAQKPSVQQIQTANEHHPHSVLNGSTNKANTRYDGLTDIFGGNSAKNTDTSEVNTANMNAFTSKRGQSQVTIDTKGAAMAFFKSDNRSKVMTKDQEKEATSLAWGVSKNAAKNVSSDDIAHATRAASKSSSSGNSGSSAFAASLIGSQLKKDNKDIMNKEQQKQAAKLSWGIGKTIAKNVTISDVKKASSYMSTSPQENTATSAKPTPQPAWMQPPSARSRPKPQPAPQQSSSAISGLAPPPNPTPRSQSGSFQGVPLQTSSQPKPAARGATSLKPPTTEQANRIKPTIIRPGASTQKSHSASNSRSSSPSPGSKTKAPPPRPSAGPSWGKKGPPPTRPEPAPASRNNTGLKPKRAAPRKPTALERHGLASLTITPPSSNENLPPRPGPGHQLYKYMHSQPHAIAQYDYEAQEKGDLAFKTDDVIILTKKIDADWYTGRCGNNEGMFPTQFVKIVVDLQEGSKESVSSLNSTFSSASAGSVSGPRCMAKHEYTSDNWDDLPFPEGAVISLLERIDQDWLKGEYKGQTGMFPKTFVDIIEDLPVGGRRKAQSSSSMDGTIATAVYDFEAADSSELSFKEGNKITVVGRFNDDWLIGELNGKQGRFPSNFVDNVPENLPAGGVEEEPRLKSVEPHAFVQYNFDADGNGELSLKAGETVVLLEKVGDDWYKGRCNGKEGMFPTNFVEVIEDLPMGGTTNNVKKDKKKLGLGRANYEFVGETDDELSFKEGEEIELVEVFNEDWMIGRLNGKEGRFPSEFVSIVTPLPS